MWKGKFITRVLALVGSLLMIGLGLATNRETFYLLVPLIIYAGGVIVLLVYVRTSAVDSQRAFWRATPLLFIPSLVENFSYSFLWGGGINGGLLVLLTVLVLLALFFYQPFLRGALR